MKPQELQSNISCLRRAARRLAGRVGKAMSAFKTPPATADTLSSTRGAVQARRGLGNRSATIGATTSSTTALAALFVSLVPRA
jgi:hypothetical protein